jgi:cyanate lyase
MVSPFAPNAIIVPSTIDFEIDIKKEEDPKGDRVVVTYSGKFLPYRKW